MTDTSQTTIAGQARRTLPLVRSIAAEIRDRMHAIVTLTNQLRRFGHNRNARTFRDLEARLSVSRRELRLAGKELQQLGWVVAQTEPVRLVWHVEDGAESFVWRPEDTAFYRFSA